MNLQDHNYQTPDPAARLDSWKEIAAYLQRDAKTARKWEKEEGLPIHRHSHKSRSSVYAYAGEIDDWRATRRVVVETVAPVPSWRRFLTPSFALTLTLCLVMVGNGVRPQPVEAQSGQTRTLVCSGAQCDGKISPDGQWLLGQVNGGLVMREIATGKVRTLAAATGWNQHADFSPDGSRIVFEHWESQPAPGTYPEPDVRIVDAEGKKSQAIFHGGYPLAWSADGTRVLVEESSAPSKLYNLTWVDVGTGTMRKLPTAYSYFYAAIVSPDGKYVAFTPYMDDNPRTNLHLMASDGSGEVVVSPSAAYQLPIAWTPDGKYLMFAQAGADVALWAAPIANGRPQGVAFNTGVKVEKEAQLAGVARSGAIYYRTISSTSDIYTATMDPGTGRVTSAPDPVPVGRTGANVLPRWSPDSKGLA